jgi:hypothetical protein
MGDQFGQSDSGHLRERARRARAMANYISDAEVRAALVTFAKELEAQAAAQVEPQRAHSTQC